MTPAGAAPSYAFLYVFSSQLSLFAVTRVYWDTCGNPVSSRVKLKLNSKYSGSQYPANSPLRYLATVPILIGCFRETTCQYSSTNPCRKFRYGSQILRKKVHGKSCRYCPSSNMHGNIQIAFTQIFIEIIINIPSRCIGR